VHEALVSTDPARPIAQIRDAWVIHHYGKLADEEVLRAKGETYLRIGQRKIEDQPDDPLGHYELGVQYAALEQHGAALPCFERALALAPRFRDTHFRMALCHVALGQHAEALAALRIAARRLPNRAAEIALTEGNVHRALGNDKAAERSFRRALDARPNFPVASFNLALLCWRQGRSVEARAYVDRALELCPAHTELRALRARISGVAAPTGGPRPAATIAHAP
jgi:tetratricopeptide (TPR) repeat protein